MAEYNYQHSFRLLKSIEDIARREHFNDLFTIDGYDFFEAYRFRIFADIKGWTKRGGAYETRNFKLFMIEIRVFILNILGLVVSYLGVIQLLLSNKKVLVYSPDKLSDAKKHHDFRLDEVYQYLIKNKIGYQEIIHTNIDKTFLYNIFLRRRLPIYLESLNFLYGFLKFFGFVAKTDLSKVDALSLEEIDPVDRDLVRLMLRKYFTELDISKFKIKMLAHIFRMLKLTTLLAIDDPRGYNELIVATKRCNIVSAAFQHGHYTKYHVGWLTSYEESHRSVRPDYIYIWSSYWKEELKNLKTIFPEEAIRIAVPKKNVVSSIKNRILNSDTITLLLPYETDAPKNEIKEYMRAFLACPNVRIILKIRSDMSREAQINEYGLDIKNEKIEISTSLDDALKQSDIVVGVYSTFLYDMIAYNIPVAIMKTGMDYGEGMVRNGVAVEIGKENVCDALETIKKTSADILEGRRLKVYRESAPTIEDALSQLLKP